MNDTADTTHVAASPAQAKQPQRRSNDVLWSASPSQIIHLPLYCVVAVLAAIPAIYAPGIFALSAFLPLLVGAWFVLQTRCTRYELTEQLLRRRSGVLNRRGEDIELYRVEDTSPSAPLLYRLYGLGNVEVISTDQTAPKLTLRAVRDHESVRRQIRERVEAMRETKGARLVE